MKRMPRAASALVWMIGAVAMHGVIPLELSRLRDRGEPPGRTRPAVRSAGLLMVAAGASLMAWAFAAHYEAAPQGWALESRPSPDLLRRGPYRIEYLLQRGPYRLTRNPMYAGETIVWLGWALFYNRVAVWTGLGILCAAWPKIVQWEERRLLEHFGDDYRAYVASVPRWVGSGRRKAPPSPGSKPWADLGQES